jgi:hypothetical protein
LAFFYLFEEINSLKMQLKPEKTTSNKKRTRKAESIFSTEIKLTASCDEGEEYVFTYSKSFSSSKTKLATKLAKSSHSTTNH